MNNPTLGTAIVIAGLIASISLFMLGVPQQMQSAMHVDAAITTYSMP